MCELRSYDRPPGRQRGKDLGVKQIELEGLWGRYALEHDREAQGRLVAAYLPLVKQVASQLSAGLPGHIDGSELVSYGLVGLNGAIERFDPRRGTRFESFAATRIRGAILDELRSIDWVPRSVRSRAREVDEARARLEHELGRHPTVEELAARMRIGEDELRRHLQQMSNGSIQALDEHWSAAETSADAISLLEVIPDPGAVDPQTVHETTDIKEQLAAAIAALPERQKLVVALYYYEGLNLKEIGAVLGVTESRVSQVHTAALSRLKQGLQAV